MALQNSGVPISLSDVNTELDLAALAEINLDGVSVRDLFGKNTGAIAMSNGYGKSSFGIHTASTLTRTITCATPATAFTPNFGYRLAVSGNHGIIAARSVYSGNTTGISSVYVHSMTDGSLLRTFDTVIAGLGPHQIQGLDVDGDLAVIGSGQSNSGVGLAYIVDVTDGTVKHTLTNPNPAANSSGGNDHFGHQACISGNYVAIGAYTDTHDTTPASRVSGASIGTVYVFAADTGALQFTLFNTGAGDYFGQFIDMGGGKIIIMSQQNVSIYSLSDGSFEGFLTTPDSRSFGGKVRLAGNRAACVVSGGLNYPSRVHIYNATTRALEGTITSPYAHTSFAHDDFGTTFDMDGDNIVIGAQSANYDGVSNPNGRGKAYSYRLDNRTLVAAMSHPAGAGTNERNFSGSVHLDRNKLIMKGAEKVYQYTLTD